MKHALSIDLDDVVHSFSANTNGYVSRLMQELGKVTELLDRFKQTATFFVPGVALLRNPGILKLIDRRHEIASHGYAHDFLTAMTPEKFDDDVSMSVEIIKRETGHAPVGYRAPGLTLAPVACWAVPILMRRGIRYSSSTPALPLLQHRFKTTPRTVFTWKEGLLEAPLSSCGGVPICGSFYTRILPFSITKALTRKYIEKKSLFYYFHPFEIVPGDIVPRRYPAIARLYFAGCKTYREKLLWTLENVRFTSYREVLGL